MAASQPRRGASGDQGQRLYTIRPLRWARNGDSGFVADATHARYIIKVFPRVMFRGPVQSDCLLSVKNPQAEVPSNVGLYRSVQEAKAAAAKDHEARVAVFLTPAGKAVRRG